MAESKQPEAVEVTVVSEAGDDEVLEEAKRVIDNAPDTEQRITTLSVLRDAVSNKADVAVVREILAIRREEKADIAREAFAASLVRFRALCPPIIKTGVRDDRKVANRDGEYGRIHYTYSELVSAVEQITPLLADCQLAATWTTIKNEPNWMEVVCRLQHTLSHFTETPFGSPPLQKLGGLNVVQLRRATLTMLQRATLFMALGLVDKDDMDKLAEETNAPPPPAPKSKVNPSLQEAAAAFTAACEKLTGRVLARDVVKNLLGQVKNVVGQEQGATSAEDIAACTKWLLENGLIMDGVVVRADQTSRDEEGDDSPDPTMRSGGATSPTTEKTPGAAASTPQDDREDPNDYLYHCNACQKNFEHPMQKRVKGALLNHCPCGSRDLSAYEDWVLSQGNEL